MLVGIQDEILRLNAKDLLAPLLADKTTKRNIIWATDAYRMLGFPYERTQEIQSFLITGAHSDVIKTRARKEMEQQSERTRRHAEVFTPLHICRRMIAAADAAYFGGCDPFMPQGVPSERVIFPRRRKWQHYVDARRLEITCGEAPYLVHRYDLATMESVPLAERQGILDRKLRVVTENATDEAEWMRWALRAYQATYGYEFQGDNLLIARVNLLMTFEEYLRARWRRKPTEHEYRAIVRTIVWNLWQMDGIRGTIPCVSAELEPMELALFELPAEIEEFSLFPAHRKEAPPVRIYDWRRQSGLEYRRVNTGGRTMKFDFVIGNPPYQDGDSEASRKPPVYNLFMDAAFKISDRVELITPARFLFEAGNTPKAWNRKMLQDPHFKVLVYESDASKIFPNTDIKGGVAITYRDAKKQFGEINVFSSYEVMNAVIKKISVIETEDNFLDKLIASQGLFRFSEQFFLTYPTASNEMGAGTGNKIVSSTMEKLSYAFLDEPSGNENYIKMIGRIRNKRAYKFIQRKFVESNAFVNKFKLFIPEANNSGKYGETLTEPTLGHPNEGTSDTFLCAGPFDTIEQPKNLAIYMKTKFFRALLGIKKVTQHCPPKVWSLIPIQDFSSSSDIDWSQSVAEIDRQLYAKYGLSAEEIAFIESHVKEMT